MIEQIKAPAPHVVSLALKGEVSKQDVEEIIELVECALENSKRVNLLFDLSEIEGITAKGLFE